MNKTRTINVRFLADVVGACGSTICALHCLIAPLLLVTGTAFPASFLGDESFHRIMILVVLPAGILAFGLGCWKHKDRAVLLLGVLGIAGMGLSATILHDLIGESGERTATVISAAMLVVAHVRNWRLCHADSCTHNFDDV
jgi:hypothetical protein